MTQNKKIPRPKPGQNSSGKTTGTVRKKPSPNHTLFEHLIEPLHQAELEAEQDADDGADRGLQDLIRQLEDGVFRRAVDEGTAEAVDDGGHNQAHQAADDGALYGALAVLIHKFADGPGDQEALQAVGDQREEHGRRIEEEIS